MRSTTLEILLLSIMVSGPVRADPATSAAGVAEAQTRFARGLDLYDEGNLAGAVAEMNRAYGVAPNFRILYDIGQIQFEMHNYSAALAAFERYLAQGGAEVPARRRLQVEQDMVKLKLRLALIDVVVNVRDAEISVDEQPVGTTPLAAPVAVSLGRHKVSAAKPGYVPAQHIVEVAGGDHAKLVLELVEKRRAVVPLPKVAPLPIAAAGAPTQETPRDRSSRERSNSWVGWVTTGALAASTAVFAGLAWSARNDLVNERNRLGTTSALLDEKHERLQRLSLAADLSLVATATALGLSLYFTLSETPRTAAVTTHIALKVSASSLSLGGKF